MELQNIKKFRKGMVAFAEKQRLMTQITRVEKGEIDFYVMNGCWVGTIRADGTAFHQHGEFSISPSDFKEVLSVTEKEFEDWYMRGEKGTGQLVKRGDNLQPNPKAIAQDEGGYSVHEVKVLVTVMGEDRSLEDLSNWVSGLSLSQLEEEMDGGELIGRAKVVASETLPRDQVGPRLKELANDGTFFETEDGTTIDPDAKKDDAAGRILRAQVAQGWTTETLEMLSRRFIDEVGLADSYASFIENQAREENDLAAVMDEEPGL